MKTEEDEEFERIASRCKETQRIKESKWTERTVRMQITVMRNLANRVPISPFHQEAANTMEKLLDELVELKGKNK